MKQYWVDEHGNNNLGVDDAGCYGFNLEVGQEIDTPYDGVMVVAKIYRQIRTGPRFRGNYVVVELYPRRPLCEEIHAPDDGTPGHCCEASR